MKIQKFFWVLFFFIISDNVYTTNSQESATNSNNNSSNENDFAISGSYHVCIYPFEIDDNIYFFLSQAFQQGLYDLFLPWTQLNVFTNQNQPQDSQPDIIVSGKIEIRNENISLKLYFLNSAGNKTIINLESTKISEIFQLNEQLQRIASNTLGKILDIEPEFSNCNQLKYSVLLLVDNSGSMDNNNKLDYAKKLVIEILDSLPLNTEIALMKYSGNNCNKGSAAHLLQGFTEAKENIISAINGFHASGGTPLATALIEAKEYLENYHRGQYGRIILIGDGEDDCKSLSEAVDTIHQSVYKINLDAIGIDMENQENASEEFKRLAASLSGNYTDLENGETLPTEFIQSWDIIDTLTRESVIFPNY